MQSVSKMQGAPGMRDQFMKSLPLGFAYTLTPERRVATQEDDVEILRLLTTYLQSVLNAFFDSKLAPVPPI